MATLITSGSRIPWLKMFFILAFAGAPGLKNVASAAPPSVNDDQLVVPLPCNSVAISQVKGTTDLFVGRRMVDSEAGICTSKRYEIVLERMHWNSLSLEYLRTLLPTPTKISSNMTISMALDPATVRFHGKDWIIFECSGKGIPSSSLCVGTDDLKSASGIMDPQNVHILVAGKSHFDTGPMSLTASVPKVFDYNGRIYMYWDAVRFWLQPPSNMRITRSSDRWISISQRGAELDEYSNTLWVKGVAAPIPSDDPEHSVEVWAPVPGDPLSDSLVDVFDVFLYNSTIYAIGSLGGSGCLTPLDRSAGCYRGVIATSRVPLGYQIFNKHVKQEPSSARQAYGHFVIKPDGQIGVVTLQYDKQPKLLSKSPSYVNELLNSLIK